MYKMIALSDWRIRWENGEKFDYKKGDKVTLTRLETRDFYMYSGWKPLEDKDLDNKESAKEAREADVAKVKAKK